MFTGLPTTKVDLSTINTTLAHTPAIIITTKKISKQPLTKILAAKH